MAALYTFNVGRSTLDVGGSHGLDHVWPLMVLGLSATGFRRLALGLLVAGPLFLWLVMSGWLVLPNPTFAVAMLTPSYVDAFAAGGLASLVVVAGSGRCLATRWSRRRARSAPG